MPKLKLIKGTRFASAIFITLSLLIAAGVIFGANMFFDIDNNRIIVEDLQRIVNNLEVAGTAIFGDGGTANFARFSVDGDLSFHGTADLITKADGDLTISTTGTGNDIFLASAATIGLTATAFDINTGTIDLATQAVAVPLANVVNALNFDANTLSIDALNNRIGIGTAAPAQELHVAGDAIIDGTVGIGTPAVPGSTLTIKRTTAGNVLAVRNLAGTADTFVVTDAGVITAGEWQGTVIDETRGGTGLSTYAIGDIIFASAANTLARRAIGAANQVLVVSGGVPVWGQVPAGGIAPDSLDWSEFKDAMTLDATTTIAMGAFDLDFGTGILHIDGGGNRVGIGTAIPAHTLDVAGDGRIATDLAVGGDLAVLGGDITTTAPVFNLVNTHATTVNFAGAATRLAVGAPAGLVIDAPGALTLEFDNLSGFAIRNDAVPAVNHLEVSSVGKLILRAGGTNQDILLDATSGRIVAGPGDVFYTPGGHPIREAGETILREMIPIFGFEMPARTASTSWVRISRTIEDYPFPDSLPMPGTTRVYRFIIRYADATTTTSSTWRVHDVNVPGWVGGQFLVPPSASGDLAAGEVHITGNITLPATNNWFLELRVATPGIGNTDTTIQVYQVFLAAYDVVN